MKKRFTKIIPAKLRKTANWKFINRRVLPALFLVLPCLSIAALPAAAQTTGKSPKQSVAAAVAKHSAPQIIGDADTQIVVDTEHHAVRVVIRGKDQLVIDESGTHYEGRLVRIPGATPQESQPKK